MAAQQQLTLLPVGRGLDPFNPSLWVLDARKYAINDIIAPNVIFIGSTSEALLFNGDFVAVLAFNNAHYWCKVETIYAGGGAQLHLIP